MDDVYLSRTITIGSLISIARELGPDGRGLAHPRSGEYNAEYARGIANLLTDAAGLSSDDADEMITAITEDPWPSLSGFRMLDNGDVVLDIQLKAGEPAIEVQVSHDSQYLAGLAVLLSRWQRAQRY